MKKILIICCLLFLTGCKNELICTMETTEENYESEQEIIFSFEDEKVNDVVVNYTMIFEDENTANSYVNVFETLEEGYEIEQEGNKLSITSKKNHEQYSETKDKIKTELESNGYKCK